MTGDREPPEARLTEPSPPAQNGPDASASPRRRSSLLTRTGVAIIVAGFVIFSIGVFPQLIQLDLTPDTGILQIAVFLVGITLMTLGAYVYMYATRHRARPRRLREDVGIRLMATGLVIAYATGFADVLGIGSHYGVDRPLFGPLQAAGIAFGIAIILFGLFLYSRR